MYRDNPVDQEDLFQEIVFQLWKSFPSFRAESQVSTWMYRIALNTAIAVFRKNRLDISFQETVSDHPFAEGKDEMSENEERMYWALKRLNTSEKAVVSLYLEDYSYLEISEIIGISENNVGVRINRIKKKLKEILNQ